MRLTLRTRHLTGALALAALLLAGGLSGPNGVRAEEHFDPYAHLRWLARHQNPDGSWGDPGTTPDERERLTSLALLNLIGVEHTNNIPGSVRSFRFRHVVLNGLKYLLASTNPDLPQNGREDTAAWPRALALTEIYRLTRSGLLADPARRAMERLARQGSRETYGAVRAAEYALVLASARRGGLPLPDALVQRIDRSIETLLAQDQRATLTTADTAALMCAVLTWRPAWLQQRGLWDRRIEKALRDGPPDDFPLLFWGSAAIAQDRGSVIRLEDLIQKRILETQVKDRQSPEYGSWNPGPSLSSPDPIGMTDLTPRQEARIRDLVKRLDDARWNERTRAEKEILNLGAVACPLLQERRDGGATEGGLRAEQLLAHIVRPIAPASRLASTCERGLLFELYHRTRDRYTSAYESCCLVEPKEKIKLHISGVGIYPDNAGLKMRPLTFLK